VELRSASERELMPARHGEILIESGAEDALKKARFNAASCSRSDAAVRLWRGRSSTFGRRGERRTSRHGEGQITFEHFTDSAF